MPRCFWERTIAIPGWVEWTVTYWRVPEAGFLSSGDRKPAIGSPEDGAAPASEPSRVGWGHFLRSIKAYAETATGTPFDRK